MNQGDDEVSDMAYLVGGDTGEYSEHRSWYVRVFLVKAVADAFCEKLNAWCREKGCTESRGSIKESWESEDGKSEVPPDDPNFCVDYTGTMYSVAEIPLDVARTLPVSQDEEKVK